MLRHFCTTTRTSLRPATAWALGCALLLAPPCDVVVAQDSLYAAIRYGQLEVVQDYLENRADPNGTASDDDGNPLRLLQVALYGRQEDIALALLEAGADFSASGVSLNLVVAEGMPRVLDFLLSDAPERFREATPAEQRELLTPAVTRGYFQVLETLLSHSRRVGLTWDGSVLSSAVVTATTFRQYDLARRLLTFGALPSDTAMVAATQNGSPGLVRRLLLLGGNPTATRPENRAKPRPGAGTPIDYAWQRYNDNTGDERQTARFILFELSRAGAVLQERDLPAGVPRNGIAELAAIPAPSTRIVEAARFGFYEVVEQLIRDREELDEDALIEAISIALTARHNDVAFLLISSGIELNEAALQTASKGNSPGIVRHLLSLGLDPNLRVDGKTAIEAWWERTADRQSYRLGADYILHELIRGGGDACWLVEHERQFNNAQAILLRTSAPRCWPE